ncbi:MAG: hypothetical protein JWM93_3212 [Frankiales bacterium]|nr:hypothetical protein [Frankiales bacterium]
MNDQVDLPARRLFPPERAPFVRDLLEREAANSRTNRRGWKSPGVLLSIGTAVVLSAGAAAAYVAFAPATDHSRVRCYTVPAAGGRDTFFGTDAGVANSADGSVAAIAALDLCGALWRSGVIAAGRAQADLPEPGLHPVPPLVACRLPDGVAAVFPGTAELCAQLGFPGLAPG